MQCFSSGFSLGTLGCEVCRVFEKWPATPRCSWPAAWGWRPCIWSSWLRAPLDPLHLRHQARCQVLSCQEHQAWRTMAWSRLLCALEVAWCLALCCWPSDSPASLMLKMWWSLCLSRTYLSCSCVALASVVQPPWFTFFFLVSPWMLDLIEIHDFFRDSRRVGVLEVW